jgi:hypothetical protein
MHTNEHYIKCYTLVIDLQGKVVFIDLYLTAICQFIKPAFGIDINEKYIEFRPVEVIANGRCTFIGYYGLS